MTDTDPHGPATHRSPAMDDEPGPGESNELHSHDLDGDDRSMSPESMTLEDAMDAEDARPEIPGETIDGLGELDEEIRHQAEDLPSDQSWR